MRRMALVSGGLDVLRGVPRSHWTVMALVSLLCGIGIATLYSVEGGSFRPWAERHGLRFLAGLAGIMVMLAVPATAWLRVAAPAYLASLALLMLVPVVGTEVLGARRWLDFGFGSFQPGELMKVALVMMLAAYYQWLPKERVGDVVWVAVPVLLIVIPAAFTVRQPDLGSAMLYAITGLGIMFMAGVPLIYFAASAVLAAAASPLIWSMLHGYQQRRIEIFLDPGSDPLGAGYHIQQSKIAFGAGGLSGTGYMKGTQSQLDFLPEKHTDFIFTMFAEEWGFAGAVVLLALQAALVLVLWRMMMSAETLFARLLIAGAALTIFLYAVVNAAMVTGLVPVVGVPMPFVSYGGTSMMSLMAALGLALSAAADRGTLGADGDRLRGLRPAF
jgi:rod shape determining protein RodA